MVTGGNRSSKQYRKWIPDNEAVGLIICLESRVYYKNVDAALFDFKNRKAGSLVKRILLQKYDPEPLDWSHPEDCYM